MRKLLAVLLLSAAVSARAAYEFVPPAPTDQTFVYLAVRREMWRDGCVPRDPRVTRTGTDIEVMWFTPRGTGCTLAITEWNAQAPIGVLAPGVYDVVVRVDDEALGIYDLATRTLVVDDATPEFSVTPRVVRAAAPVTARLSLCRHFSAFPATPVVTVDGTTAASRVERCNLDVTLPSLAPGPVNIRVRVGDRTFEVVNAVRSIDPSAAPDPALFERVLVPTLFNGPGAYGSVWETDVTMVNASERTIELLPEVMRPLPPLASGASTSLLPIFGNRPAGLVLFIPRGAQTRFGSIVRDTSRDADDLGTEVRVAREDDTSSSLTLPNVPFDSRYRVQLRVYDVEGVTTGVNIFARAGTQQPRITQALVPGPCEDVPCNSNQPAFAFVDLTDAFPGLTGRHDVTIVSDVFARRLWAFITLTNNVTQRVTVISPQ